MKQAGPVDERSGKGVSSNGATHPALGVASSIVVLASTMVLSAYEWRGWHVGLLIWGLSVMAVIVVCSLVSAMLALRSIPDTPATEERRRRLRSTRGEINFVIVGVGVAVLASGSNWVAVDVAFTAFAVVVVGGSPSQFPCDRDQRGHPLHCSASVDSPRHGRAHRQPRRTRWRTSTRPAAVLTFSIG